MALASGAQMTCFVLHTLCTARSIFVLKTLFTAILQCTEKCSLQSTSNRGTVVCLPYIASGIIWKAILCPLLLVHSFYQCIVPEQEGTERVARHMLLVGQRSVIMTLATDPPAICIVQNVRLAYHWHHSTTWNAWAPYLTNISTPPTMDLDKADRAI